MSASPLRTLDCRRFGDGPLAELSAGEMARVEGRPLALPDAIGNPPARTPAAPAAARFAAPASRP